MTQIVTNEIKRRSEEDNEGFVDVGPVDAKRRGVGSGVDVKADAMRLRETQTKNKLELKNNAIKGAIDFAITEADIKKRRATPTADSDSLAPAAEPASSTVPEAAAEAAPVVPIDDYTFDQMASDLKRMLAFIATHNEDRRTVETLERRVTSPVVGTDHQTQQFTVGPVASQILPWKESKESPGRSPWVPGAPSAVLQRPSPPPSVPGALIPR